MTIGIAEMRGSDYEETYALWKLTEGMGLSSADTQEAISAYLKRNPGLSLVVREAERIIATVLCGHDGRRGYLHHLAVAPDHRGRGIGKRLVNTCLERLAQAGIQKCHIFLHQSNSAGKEFWRAIGWTERAELRVMSHDIKVRCSRQG